MTVQRREQWLCPCVLAVLLLLSPFLGAAATWQGTPYTHDSLQEVEDIPIEGGTRLCVVPLDIIRLKVRHTNTAGGRQEVVVKRKLLPPDTLSVLEIEVEADAADKDILSVSLNGTQLKVFDNAPRMTSPAPQRPRTALLLKGSARIAKCPVEAGESVASREMKLRELAETTEQRGEVTEGQAGKVTEDQGGEKVTEEQGGKVTEGQGEKVTEEKGGEGVSSNASVTLPLSSVATNVTAETEDPDSGLEEPWWNFLLVLGKVGEVPVLVLLLACLLVGVVVGCILVCLCTKVCQKRRAEYSPVPARRTRSGQVAADIVRDPKFWDTISSRQRSSGIGSAFSTLNTDNGSHMGTANRPIGSANNSIDRSTRVPTHLEVNNLGRAPSVSPSNSINRSRNNSSHVLNIPQGSGLPRSSSNRSTGSSDNRDMDRSPMLSQGSRVERTSSNRSTGSSINRNTNRSPNIPYNKKLGIFVGHQDAPLLQKPINRHEDFDDDSDDPSYDKPYISSPIVAENYSVPHGSTAQQVLVELRTTTTASNDPNARQVPVYEFGTFKK